MKAKIVLAMSKQKGPCSLGKRFSQAVPYEINRFLGFGQQPAAARSIS